mgnify:FL=1
MRTAISTVVALILSLIVLSSVYIAVDNAWSEGEKSIQSSGNYFSDCINIILTDDEGKCELFKDPKSTDGG